MLTQHRPIGIGGTGPVSCLDRVVGRGEARIVDLFDDVRLLLGLRRRGGVERTADPILCGNPQ